jgi:hypothetical protein
MLKHPNSAAGWMIALLDHFPSWLHRRSKEGRSPVHLQSRSLSHHHLGKERDRSKEDRNHGG